MVNNRTNHTRNRHEAARNVMLERKPTPGERKLCNKTSYRYWPRQLIWTNLTLIPVPISSAKHSKRKGRDHYPRWGNLQSLTVWKRGKRHRWKNTWDPLEKPRNPATPKKRPPSHNTLQLGAIYWQYPSGTTNRQPHYWTTGWRGQMP